MKIPVRSIIENKRRKERKAALSKKYELSEASNTDPVKVSEAETLLRDIFLDRKGKISSSALKSILRKWEKSLGKENIELAFRGLKSSKFISRNGNFLLWPVQS